MKITIVYQVSYRTLNTAVVIAAVITLHLHTYTGSNWYKYDDMTSKRSVANEKEKICPHLIIYVKH